VCYDITWRPAQHLPNFIETHRKRPFERRHNGLFRVAAVSRTKATAKRRYIGQRDEELYALSRRRQSCDTVGTVLAERRIDLHEEIEKRCRDFLQRSKNTHTHYYLTCCDTAGSTSESATAHKTRDQSNLTKSASRGAHSPVRGNPRGSKFVPLNSWGRVSY